MGGHAHPPHHQRRDERARRFLEAHRGVGFPVQAARSGAPSGGAIPERGRARPRSTLVLRSRRAAERHLTRQGCRRAASAFGRRAGRGKHCPFLIWNNLWEFARPILRRFKEQQLFFPHCPARSAPGKFYRGATSRSVQMTMPRTAEPIAACGWAVAARQKGLRKRRQRLPGHRPERKSVPDSEIARLFFGGAFSAGAHFLRRAGCRFAGKCSKKAKRPRSTLGRSCSAVRNPPATRGTVAVRLVRPNVMKHNTCVSGGSLTKINCRRVLPVHGR